MSITQAAGKVVDSVVTGVVTTTWRGAAGAVGLAGQGARAAVRVAGTAVRGTRQVAEDQEVPTPVHPVDAPAPAASQSAPEPDPDPREELPGPDVVAPAIPRAEDLPEPVVIEPAAEGVGEFHTEPKPVSRESARGSTAADPEDVSGYDEEVVEAAD